MTRSGRLSREPRSVTSSAIAKSFFSGRFQSMRWTVSVTFPASTFTGTPYRNNTPSGTNIPTEWEIATGKNIKWRAELGSQHDAGIDLAQRGMGQQRRQLRPCDQNDLQHSCA